MKGLWIVLYIFANAANGQEAAITDDNSTSSCGEEGICLNDHVELYIEKRTRTHPLVKLLHEESTATAANFRSLSGRKLDIWYDDVEDGGEGIEQGHLSPGTTSTINTYEGHSFFITPIGRKGRVLTRITISKEKVFYLIEDPEVPGDESLLLQARQEEMFIAEYTQRSGGIPWRHYYNPVTNQPRPPPVLYMWPMKEVGDVHRVISHQGYWKCAGSRGDCQDSTQPVTLELEAVSLTPKVFLIEHFLSDFEVSDIIQYSQSRVSRSRVGNADGGGILSSSTRTSSNTWIPRSTSDIIDTIYHRAGDVLQVDESLLYTHKNAEDLQVVHYIHGQKYDIHSDWDNAGYAESRYITLLLYLTDMPVNNPYAGGETAFPQARRRRTTVEQPQDNNTTTSSYSTSIPAGFKVQPKKGTAVLFYNLLEDGNGDNLSVHASFPTVDGEKWLANLWVWDPKRI